MSQHKKTERSLGYSNEELAIAYELRQSGCIWRNICTGLGGKVDTLKHAIMRAERRGLKTGAAQC